MIRGRGVQYNLIRETQTKSSQGQVVTTESVIKTFFAREQNKTTTPNVSEPERSKYLQEVELIVRRDVGITSFDTLQRRSDSQKHVVSSILDYKPNDIMNQYQKILITEKDD